MIKMLENDFNQIKATTHFVGPVFNKEQKLVFLEQSLVFSNTFLRIVCWYNFTNSDSEVVSFPQSC